MPKQLLITETDLNKFKKTVNDHLENGWRVVPGTLTLAGWSFTGRSRVESCAVVVECDEVET